MRPLEKGLHSSSQQTEEKIEREQKLTGENNGTIIFSTCMEELISPVVCTCEQRLEKQPQTRVIL